MCLSSVGHDAVLPLRAEAALGFVAHEGLPDLSAGGLGENDSVDEAALGGYVGGGEGFAVFLYLPAPGGGAVVGGLDLTAEDDVGGSFRSHDGDLGLGPRENNVGSEGLAAHAEVRSSVGLADDYGDEGNGGFAVGVEHLGAVADDASEFLLGAGEVPGDVDEGDDGDVEGVAVADETAGLVGGVDVEAAGKVVGLVGYDAYNAAAHPAVAGEDVPGPEFLDFKEVSVVKNTAENVPHVVSLVGVGGNDVPEFHVLTERVVGCFLDGRSLEVVEGEVPEEFPDLGEAFVLGPGSEVGVAALGVVGHGAAEFFTGDFFAGDGLDDRGAGDVHDAGALHHEDVVGERRAVDGSSGGGAGDDRELGDDSAADGVAVEDVSVSVERVDCLLDTGSAAVVDAHHGASGGQGEVHDLADLGGVHLSERTAEYGEVLAVDVDFPPLYKTPAGDDTVGVVLGLLESEVGAPVTDEFVQLHKGAGVHKLLYALTGSPLSLRLLLLDRLRAASRLRFLPLLVKLLTELVYAAVCHVLYLPPFLLFAFLAVTEYLLQNLSGN